VDARPLRADARRNQERLLSAARDAFTVHGERASLDDIVKRAGVGPGTLYRHFPNREALLAAVFTEDVTSLAAQAKQLSAELPPMAALTEFLRVQVEYGKSRKGVGLAVKAMFSSDCEVLNWCRDTLCGALGVLLEAAQREGHVRTDIDSLLVLRLGHGVAMASEFSPDDSGRMLAVVIDGLRRR
jgi:AcrR family transcriptional regulator